MAGFEIGGNGNEYDKYLQNASNAKKPKPKPGKKIVLTKEQQQAIQDMLKKGKLRPPKTNTKYGTNTPHLPQKLPDGGIMHTKYGANTPQLPPHLPQFPDGGAHTKYGANTPQLPQFPPNGGTHTRYGINCSK